VSVLVNGMMVLREVNGEVMLICRLSTRCRDTEGGVASVVATRARWRVDSDSTTSNSKLNDPVDKDVWEGAGEMGNTVVLGTMTGNVEDDSWDCGRVSAVVVVVVVVVVVEAEGGTGIPVGSPCAARALTTESQPFSSVLIRSLNSSFSLSRALSRSCSSSRDL